MKNIKQNAIALIAGSTSVFAFAPFDTYPAILVSLLVLVCLSHSLKPTQSALLGMSFGMGMYLTGVSWVYVSLSTYGGMPLWMGLIAVFGFAAVMAAFIAITLWVSSWISSGDPRRYLVAFPFVWTVFEWCKSWVFTGFPWLDIGYSQTQSWLFTLAPIGGVYLISFWVMVIVCMVAGAIILRSRASIVFSLFLLFLPAALKSIDWVRPDGNLVQIGVVQANIPIESKWEGAAREATIRQYQRLSHELSRGTGLDLIVWPETALPLYLSQTDQKFWEALLPDNVSVVTGLLDHDEESAYNAAALICQSERAKPQVYRKAHLVPFGEYQPLQFIFGWVFEYLNLPMSGFAAWQGQQELSCGDSLRLGMSICYEDTFAEEYRRSYGSSNILLNISEDAWFGDSLAPHQRRQLAQMRAKELGRPMIRSANSGPSLFIDHQGTVVAKTAQFEVASMTESVQPMTGTTPFARFGLWIVWISIAMTLVMVVIRVTMLR